jgi:hypothetical protein
MKFFWRVKEEDRKIELCIEPCSVLLSLVKQSYGWTIQCLSEVVKPPKLELPELKEYAAKWLVTHLAKIQANMSIANYKFPG